jgi:3-methyladenine DNA glycosylase AlkD
MAGATPPASGGFIDGGQVLEIRRAERAGGAFMGVDRELIAAVRRELAARADPVRAAAEQAYMKSAMPYYGLTSPQLRQVTRQVFADHPLETFDGWRDTTLAMWREATRAEERYAALALAADRRYRRYRDITMLPMYEEFIVTGAWWDYVDTVVGTLIDELLDTDRETLTPILLQWSTDENLWKRRASIIAQIKKKDGTDLSLLYACIEPNRGDKEFFIRKAIGWALRSYAWVDLDEVERYCDTHELSPLSRREALKNAAKIRAGR